MFIGMSSGETLPAPLASITSCWWIRLVTPPTPVPITTATRSGSRPFSSALPAKPASDQASAAATSAACCDRSSRRACTLGSTLAGSTAISPAIRTAISLAQSWVSARMPELPASSSDQYVGTSPPSGVVAPSPVTTTGSSVRLASVIVTSLVVGSAARGSAAATGGQLPPPARRYGPARHGCQARRFRPYAVRPGWR